MENKMTVGELIGKLMQYDPYKEVLVSDNDLCVTLEIEKVSEDEDYVFIDCITCD